MRLLHIDSSIQGDNSASRALSAQIVEQLVTARPDVDVTYRDLAAEPLAHISLSALAEASTGSALEEFLAADIVVIGAPMYNLALSSQLKAWIDQIVIAGKTFQYSPDGVVGLAGDKCVIVAHTRGGFYGAESPAASFEHAESYLRAILGFIGVADIEVIVAEGLALGDEPREAALSQARDRIAKIVGPTPQNAA